MLTCFFLLFFWFSCFVLGSFPHKLFSLCFVGHKGHETHRVLSSITGNRKEEKSLAICIRYNWVSVVAAVFLFIFFFSLLFFIYIYIHIYFGAHYFAFVRSCNELSYFMWLPRTHTRTHAKCLHSNLWPSQRIYIYLYICIHLYVFAECDQAAKKWVTQTKCRKVCNKKKQAMLELLNLGSSVAPRDTQ